MDSMRSGAVQRAYGTRVDALGRFERRQTVGEAALRLAANVHQVVPHLDRPLDAAERSVPGHDDRWLERDDRVERPHPLRAGALPPDRRAESEEDVAGEDDALARQVHDEVSGRVRRTDPDEMRREPVEVELQPLVDQRRGRRQLDLREIPVGELRRDVGDRRLAASRGVAQRLQHARVLLGEILRAQAVADDLGAGKELVAPAVVAVVVRVDDPARRARPHAPVRRDQIARVRQVPEGVDDEAAVAVQQTGVAGSETTILLHAGVHRGRELDEVHGPTVSPGRDAVATSRCRRRPGAFTHDGGRSTTTA